LIGKLALKKSKAKKEMQGRFTPRQLQGQALRVFEKKSSFPRFARKEYFSQKTLRVALFTRTVLRSFFLFLVFFFPGLVVSVALRSARCHPRAAAARAHARHPTRVRAPGSASVVHSRSPRRHALAAACS